MANLTVRNVEEDTKQRLRLRAARHGRSMEEEVRSILRDAAATPQARMRATNLYEDIRELVAPHGGFDIPVPDRRSAARPIPFQDRGDGDDHP